MIMKESDILGVVRSPADPRRILIGRGRERARINVSRAYPGRSDNGGANGNR